MRWWRDYCLIYYKDKFMSEIPPVYRPGMPEGVGSGKHKEIVGMTRKDHIREAQKNLATINIQLDGDLSPEDRKNLEIRKGRLAARLKTLTGEGE